MNLPRSRVTTALVEAEATEAMSRHIVTALSALLLTTAIATGAASGGTAPGKLAPVNLSAPAISGAAQVGQALTANVGTWSGKSLQYSYGWLTCDSSGAACSSLSGETAANLTLTSARLGRTIRAVVIATNRNGSAAATSAPTAPVVNGSTSPPLPPPPPPPSGSSFYLSNLSWTTATNGWGPVERDLSNGEQALGDGHTITLNGQTFSKGLGVHASSDVRFGVGGCTRFLASVGIDDEEGTYGSALFQVYADGTKTYDSGVMTATTPTATVDLDITGKSELRLVVGNGGDNSNSDHADWAGARVSCESAPVPPPATPSVPTLKSAPTISGSAQQGQTLTAAAGTWSGSTPMTYSYQWQRCNSSGGSCTSVAGSAASYALGAGDVGSTMRVSVTATNSIGSATASSAPTSVVAAPPAVPSPIAAPMYSKTFDDALIVSGAWGVQDTGTVPDTSGIHRGTVAADSSTSNGGSWSGRFDLPAYTGGRTAGEVRTLASGRPRGKRLLLASLQVQRLRLGRLSEPATLARPVQLPGNRRIASGAEWAVRHRLRGQRNLFEVPFSSSSTAATARRRAAARTTAARLSATGSLRVACPMPALTTSSRRATSSSTSGIRS